MIPRSFLAYAVARHNAAELDRRGQRPGLLLRLVGGAASLAVLGMALTIAFALCHFLLWELGIIA